MFFQLQKLLHILYGIYYTIWSILFCPGQERKKNVNAHNYGQWIGVEKDLSVIKPCGMRLITKRFF